MAASDSYFSALDRHGRWFLSASGVRILGRLVFLNSGAHLYRGADFLGSYGGAAGLLAPGRPTYPSGATGRLPLAQPHSFQRDFLLLEGVRAVGHASSRADIDSP